MDTDPFVCVPDGTLYSTSRYDRLLIGTCTLILESRSINARHGIRRGGTYSVIIPSTAVGIVHNTLESACTTSACFVPRSPTRTPGRHGDMDVVVVIYLSNWLRKCKETTTTVSTSSNRVCRRYLSRRGRPTAAHSIHAKAVLNGDEDQSYKIQNRQ